LRQAPSATENTPKQTTVAQIVVTRMLITWVWPVSGVSILEKESPRAAHVGPPRPGLSIAVAEPLPGGAVAFVFGAPTPKTGSVASAVALVFGAPSPKTGSAGLGCRVCFRGPDPENEPFETGLKDPSEPRSPV
jgi:hypothetical protein